MVAGKVSTLHNLIGKVVISKSISDICSLYEKERGTINNLYIHRDTSSIFGGQLLRCGLAWPSWILFGDLLLLETWRVPTFLGFGLLLWKIIPFAILVYMEERN